MHPEHLKHSLLTLCVSAVLGLGLTLTASHAAAADDRIPSLTEMRILPPYCAHTQIISSSYGRQQAPGQYDAQTKPYVDLYGDDFWHLHHYCFGLVQANRAYKAQNAGARKGHWTRAVGEIDYVIRSATPGFILLPELRTQRATVLLKLNRNAEAVLELQKAIQQDPNYARAYAVLGDYYRDARNKSMALKTLEDGLTHSPDDRGLLRRYANLGGTRKFEAPPSPPETVATPEASTPATAGAPAETIEARPPVEIQPFKQGNDKNPYCRFCPE
ncbi:MAG: hypothetical protein IV085_01125 [Thiobacillus sp.]|nr:hypothetical protein [Thiobacillus sp.]